MFIYEETIEYYLMKVLTNYDILKDSGLKLYNMPIELTIYEHPALSCLTNWRLKIKSSLT
jgi:hypothetical protein